MTRDTFEVLVSNLIEAFNGRKLSSAVLKEYYSILQSIPEAKKDEFFSHCLREFSFFPKIKEIADFVKYHYPVKIEKRYETEIDDGFICPYCLNVGLIRGEWKGSQPFPDQIYSADLPCPKCERGKRYHGKATPFFDKQFGNEYLEQIRETKKADYSRMVSWQNSATKKVRDISETKTRIKLILRNWNTNGWAEEPKRVDVEREKHRIYEELAKV